MNIFLPSIWELKYTPSSLSLIHILQKADSGSRYEVFTIPQGNSYKNYVINTSGRIAKNTTVKDRDGVKYKTNSGGVLVKEDDESVDGGTYSSPEEPDWSAFGDDY